VKFATVLGKSHIKFHTESADLLSEGTAVWTTSRFAIKSRCFSAQPVAAAGSRYSVVPYQGRIYIHAEQGDLLVKARPEMRVPAGKTVAITSCGKSGEVMRFVGGNEFPLQAVFAGALATRSGSAGLPKK
jgi:hypothetical protein